MYSKYKAVLFDFDGTIADTGEGIFSSVRYAISESGFPPLDDARIRTFIGPPVFDSFRRECGMNDEEGRNAVEKYREAYSAGGIFQFRLYDGIAELIKELKKNGIRVGIASSKPEKFLIRIIDYLDFNDLIDFISAPVDDATPQNKSALILNAVREFDVNKNEVLMVGDRMFDINGADKAGVESVGVTFGYGSDAELTEAGATYIANTADEIRDVIFSLQPSLK